MKILVVGSNHFPDSAKVQEQLEQACRDIGAALATAGHDLIVGSSNPNTADRFVIEGVASVAGKHKVLIFRPDEGPTPFTDQPVPNQKRIQFTVKRCPGPWTVGRIHQILAADAVIIIGGGGGAAQAGYSAPLLGVPVLAVPAFGGAAKDVWDYLTRDYEKVAGVQEHTTELREAWRPEHARGVVAAVSALVGAKLYRSRHTFQGLLELVASVAMLVGWVLLFGLPPPHGEASFFLLLLLSALLGTVLRRTLRSLSQSIQVQQGPTFWSDATCSVLVAFGLMLIAFMGDLTLTGEFDLLNPQPAAFQRVSIVFSVIGLFAGFLMEKAARLLAAKLGAAVADDSA